MIVINIITKWFGLDTLSEEEFRKLKPQAEVAIMKAALYYEGKVKLKLNASIPRTGRMYGDHQASAPGEPPAPLSGDLKKSITHSEVIWNGYEGHAEVGSAMPYAKILEFGGIINRVSPKGKHYVIRILPRPYFSATWMEQEAKMQSIMDKAMRAAPVLVDLIPEVAE